MLRSWVRCARKAPRPCRLSAEITTRNPQKKEGAWLRGPRPFFIFVARATQNAGHEQRPKPGLLGETDGIEDGGKRRAEGGVVGARSDANKINQAFGPHHSEEPVRFLAFSRRVVAEIGRKGWL